MRAAIAERGEAVIVLATGASQFETVAVLTAAPGIAWDRVGALLVALLLLTTQRHEEKLAESRAHHASHRHAERAQDRQGHRTAGGAAP